MWTRAGFVVAGDTSGGNTSVVSAASLAEAAHGQVTLDSKIQMWRATVQNEAASDSSPEYDGSFPSSPRRRDLTHGVVRENEDW